jgi:hypothetical protein
MACLLWAGAPFPFRFPFRAALGPGAPCALVIALAHFLRNGLTFGNDRTGAFDRHGGAIYIP